MASYHNTLFLDDNLKHQFETKAKNQEEIIYELFLQHKEFTRADLMGIFKQVQDKTSESSISRSLSNLSKEGKVIKTTDKRIGEYGAPNSIYRLVDEEHQVEKVSHHRLKLDTNECLALELMIEDFISNHKNTGVYEDSFFNVLNGMKFKLNKIKY
jgi:hypothetical protein